MKLPNLPKSILVECGHCKTNLQITPKDVERAQKNNKAPCGCPFAVRVLDVTYQNGRTLSDYALEWGITLQEAIAVANQIATKGVARKGGKHP